MGKGGRGRSCCWQNCGQGNGGSAAGSGTSAMGGSAAGSGTPATGGSAAGSGMPASGS